METSVLLISLWLLQTDDIQDLQHKDAKIRRAAAQKLGLKHDARAVWNLIEALKDADPEVRTASHEALVAITGQNLEPATYTRWKDWWDSTGSKQFSDAVTREILERSRVEMQQLIDNVSRQGDVKIQKIENEVETASRNIRMAWLAMFGMIVLFLGVFIYLVGHISSRLKEWKETVKQAEFIMKESRTVTERVDKILDEVERKKNDLVGFFSKLKDGAEEELARYSDMMQQNSDHHLREEVMELRQKAEKELEQTLNELKNAMDHEMRKIATSHKERLEKDVREEFVKFQKEVLTHSLFLEATFYATLRKYDAAIAAYRKVLDLKPDHHVAILQIGNMMREMSKVDQAIEQYQKALEIAPEDPQVCFAMAAAWAKKKDKTRMIDFLRRAFKHDGEFKDEALNDPAFREYWNDREFKDIAET